MTKYLCVVVSICASWLAQSGVAAEEVATQQTPRPNIVFFLVDDLGWADLGCYGSTFHETPHVDALAASAMRFTNAYATCPVCSPTRASILTGRHPVRVDVTDWIPGARSANGKFEHIDDRDNLALSEVTIAEELREHGYRTFFAGKWHLGDEGHWPTDQGFEFNIGGTHAGSPPEGYYAPWKNPNLEAKEKGEYLTERLTKESVKFIEQHGREPFLLYLSYYNVHTPITAYEKRIEHFREKARQQFPDDVEPIQEHHVVSRSRQDNPEFASMVAAMDLSVGTVLDALKKNGLDDNTIVIFFSDNGGLCTKPKPGPTSNLPLRSGKGWLYEGGIREPLVIRAPGVTNAGEVCDQPVVSTDFFPTILDLIGLSQKPKLHADGISLMPWLKDTNNKTDRTLYWHYPHYHGSKWTPGAAIRDGDWKLIEFYEYDESELYNLASDPGEHENVFASHPKIAERLKAKLKTWQTEMNAKMPKLRVK